MFVWQVCSDLTKKKVGNLTFDGHPNFLACAALYFTKMSRGHHDGDGHCSMLAWLIFQVFKSKGIRHALRGHASRG